MLKTPRTLYLAGPMSGIPQFNFPLFNAAAHQLRNDGWRVINPAETDPEAVRTVALASKDGSYDANGKVGPETWGDILSRDVKMLADGALDGLVDVETPNGAEEHEERTPIDGIALLPGWEKSRGARLESFVMVDSLKDKLFFTVEQVVDPEREEENYFVLTHRDREWVMYTLAQAWADGIKMHTPIPYAYSIP